jgi:hypothetical protein
MYTYDLTHFQKELPEALWEYIHTFLLGNIKDDFLYVFQRAEAPILDYSRSPMSQLPIFLGRFLLKYKNIWYFEKSKNAEDAKYHHFLSKIAIPYTNMYLGNNRKNFEYLNLLNMINNKEDFHAYQYFSYFFSKNDGNGKNNNKYNIYSYINIPDNQVTALDLEDNSLSDWDAKLIADEIQRNKNLDSIFLERNNIGDIGLRAILESLFVNTSVCTLRLPYNNLSDASGNVLLNYLESSGTSLTGLSLHHNKFSSSMRLKIRKAWKDRSFGLSI